MQVNLTERNGSTSMGSPQRISLAERSLADLRLFVAGYTGRDREAVMRHIDELQAIGIAPPPDVPMYYELDRKLLTQTQVIAGSSSLASGAVEPVYMRLDGHDYFGIGSDHTDRELEAVDIAESKAKCGKPVGAEFVPVPSLEEVDIDSWRVVTTVDGVRYQDDALRTLLQPRDILSGLVAHFSGVTDFVCFGGTVPLLNGEFISGEHWEMALRYADGTAPLQLSYTVR